MTGSLFRAKYRIKSARLVGWDYSSPGYYFVTICTHERQPYLGEIVDGAMRLSKIGVMAEQFFIEIPGHFPNADVDEFVVMPNHVHGIIVIKESMVGSVETQRAASLQDGHVASTGWAFCIPTTTGSQTRSVIGDCPVL